jgi:hypothetical protein
MVHPVNVQVCYFSIPPIIIVMVVLLIVEKIPEGIEHK